MKYTIGDTAWWPTFSPQEARETCPDCCGTGHLKVTLGDATEVRVDCQNCVSGFHGPLGYIRVYARTPRAEQVTIKGVRVEPEEGLRYETSGTYSCPEGDLYTLHADAFAAAVIKAAEMDAEERSRIQNREKDHRSWAWNANYHRQCIREANRMIAYHTSKLSVAALKAKEKAA